MVKVPLRISGALFRKNVQITMTFIQYLCTPKDAFASHHGVRRVHFLHDSNIPEYNFSENLIYLRVQPYPCLYKVQWNLLAEKSPTIGRSVKNKLPQSYQMGMLGGLLKGFLEAWCNPDTA